MKRIILLTLVFVVLTGMGLSAQKAPLAYILPAGDKVVVVLGDTPRSVMSFDVYRKAPGEKEFKLLTEKPVAPVKDPYKAVELMGSDFHWIAKRIGSEDPSYLYNRLKVDRNTTLALCLISHGLRMAMGRTYIDSNVSRGKSYSYRVVLLNILGKEIKRVEKTVRVEDSLKPPMPSELKAVAGDGNIKLSWKYPPYRGGEKDLAVGFILYRKDGEGKYRRITEAPILRIEGWLSYVDDRVKNGVFYTYAIEAINMIGAKSEKVYSEAVKPVDKKPPLVPSGIKAVDSKDGVLLLWKISPEVDADHYNVYRGDSVKGKFERINKKPIPADSPRFLDKEAVRGVVHYYRVSAVDKSGNESAMSGPASIIPKDTEPPPPVEGLSGDVEKEKRYVSLSWKALGNPDLSGYFVYRGESKDRMMRITEKPLKPSGSPAYLDAGYKKRGLRPGIPLWYAVTGVDNSGNEGDRVYIQVMIPDNVPPPPPFYLTAKPTDEGNVLLTWQPCLSRDLDKHFVYRRGGTGGGAAGVGGSSGTGGSATTASGAGSSSGAGDSSANSGSSAKGKKGFVKIKELDKKVTEWVDETVSKGTEYRYFVTEVDTSGNESKPSREVKVIPTDIVPPKPPAGLKAKVEKWGIRLTWEASPDKDVKGYLIYRIPPKGERWKQITKKPLKELEFFDRWAKPGSRYGVTAIDTSGNESRKVTVTAEKEKKESKGGAAK